MSSDATASVTAAFFGLDGFVVLAAAEVGGELELLVETTADLVGCRECGAVARAKDRRPTWVRDLPIGGRPVVICWNSGSGAARTRRARSRPGRRCIRRLRRGRV